jgi:DNA-binding NarL/FixJ family response regulator
MTYRGRDPLIRIFIVDDQLQIRRGLTMRLELESDLEVVGAVGDGLSALAIVEESRPDLILIDLEMPEMDGISTARLIHERLPACPIVMLSLLEDEETKQRVGEAGASAFVSKRQMDHVLIATIHAVAGHTNAPGRAA